MTIKDDSGEAMAISSDDVAAARDVPQALPEQPTPVEEQPIAETPLANSWYMNDDDVDDEEERRIQHWKESPFAVGLVDVTWADSRRRNSLVSEREGHLKASAWICTLLRAGRVGNMAVLKQSTGYPEIQREIGTVERVECQEPSCVAGPYWFVPCCITYPIILVVTFLTARRIIHSHVAIIVVWALLTTILLTSLSLVACRNPGIMHRHSQSPHQDWRWNDQARTFRPKSAKYDPECAVVIEGFDHTCPWTGTAIGKRNMMAFRVFLGSVIACLVMDIMLVVNPF